MVRASERDKILNEIESLCRHMAMDGEDSGEELEELMELYHDISSNRYLNPRTEVPKSSGLRDLFWDLSDNQFRCLVRMDKHSFLHVLNIISQNAAFKNNANNKQVSVWVQLMVALYRFGCDGNGASIEKCATYFGISYGSVVKFTERVIKAFIDLKDQFIHWPTAAERAAISHRFAVRHGLPGAVGIIDGTPVHLFERPGVDGEVWWTRKSR